MAAECGRNDEKQRKLCRYCVGQRQPWIGSDWLRSRNATIAFWTGCLLRLSSSDVSCSKRLIEATKTRFYTFHSGPVLRKRTWEEDGKPGHRMFVEAFKDCGFWIYRHVWVDPGFFQENFWIFWSIEQLEKLSHSSKILRFLSQKECFLYHSHYRHWNIRRNYEVKNMMKLYNKNIRTCLSKILGN